MNESIAVGSAEGQEAAAKLLEAMLRRDVLDVWFPRCIDHECGGFLSDFDRHWRPQEADQKLLEFQARQTWLAAEASLAYPQEAHLRDAATHGFLFLRDVMWDHKGGGWYHMVDRSGQALEAATKHAHGMAYAIPACLSVYLATGAEDALELAQAGFAWLERHSHDQVHGGYFGFMKRDGSPILLEADCPWPSTHDTIGTPIGWKDANVHTDLLETFVYLDRFCPQASVGERLEELVDIVLNRLSTVSGAIHTFCEPDWTSVPGPCQFGFGFQAAHRLLAVRSRAVHERTLLSAARRFVGLALENGWDPRKGGFFLAAIVDPDARPASVVDRRKLMWVQLEALWALLALSLLDTEDKRRYQDSVASHWRYVQSYLLDKRCLGLYEQGLDTLGAGWQQRISLALSSGKRVNKGHIWKDGSHEGRALLKAIHALRQRPPFGSAPDVFPVSLLATESLPSPFLSAG